MGEKLTFRLGELFSGPGGMALGAHSAANKFPNLDLVHAWANDFDPSTCETYIRNIPGANTSTVFCGDVSDFSLETAGKIDGLAFGFPCNDFSLVGKWQGLDGNFGPLYKYGVQALTVHNPLWFVAENVGGLKGANGGKAFQLILEELASAGEFGYDLVPHLYQFDLYGVPQRRKRILIVGIRKDQNLKFRVPSPNIYADIDVSVISAISNPPISTSMKNHELTNQSIHVIERLKHIKPGENAFTANLPPELRLNVKGATISQIYRRLRPDMPAYTLTGSGGGGTHVYHWEEPRALTNRERARLQTFPDDFVFSGSKEKVRKQIGMAVPVKGAEAIFEAIYKTFLGERYEYVDQNIFFK